MIVVARLNDREMRVWTGPGGLWSLMFRVGLKASQRELEVIDLLRIGGVRIRGLHRVEQKLCLVLLRCPGLS